ncbi:MAG: sensor histidine kinase [Acutalibacteraceae bacterium]
MKDKKKKEKKGSLFKRYFGRSAITVFLGFLSIGFVMIFFISNQWWTEKTDLLIKNAQDIAKIYSNIEEYESEKQHLEVVVGTLKITRAATNSDYFIVDSKGKCMYCGDGDGFSDQCEDHKNFLVDSKNMERAIDGGFADYMNDDQFGLGKFVVAVPVKNHDKTEAVIFAVEDAITGLIPYVASITQAFSYCILFALVVVFIAIYLITRGIIKPLSEMQEVVRHFAKGEFEYRANENYDKKDFRELAKALNKMAYELAIDEEAQRSFIANVSHELKTPMTTIGGFVDGILDGTIPPQEEKKYLTVVSSEVKRLSRMVVSMLNLSKIESGEVQLSPIQYDVSKQIFETLLSFEKKINEKNIEILGFENMNEVMIEADRDLIQQVIYNLLDNAVKFTPENGKITIFASCNEENTKVAIRNSGAGISQEELARIFERFYKVDKSRSFDTNGVGLGLYIVKTIVNMHDGEITADSKQGEYTEFSFVIPHK